ncbi:MAG: stage II sporulation protein R [Clostridiales bacterium]|nr:stage II sporulation protein R [Clostridiales bacterium]
MKRGRILKFALLCALLCACVQPLARASRVARELSGCVIRLHIRAESDAEEHQRLKLLVRDALSALLNDGLSAAASKQEALHLLEGRLDEIEAVAERTLRAQGCTAPVAAALAEQHFPLRRYGELTLPAGRYTALTLTIGGGQGQNWWCVMYPPLCYAGEELQNAEAAARFFDERLSPEAMRVLRQEETVYRFFLADQLKKLLSDSDGEGG